VWQFPLVERNHRQTSVSQSGLSSSAETVESKRPFRRLAILLPPSMSDELKDHLGKLGTECDTLKRNDDFLGYSESAEIIAEVLSLVKMERDKTKSTETHQNDETIQRTLKENPLLLYYTSIDLLSEVSKGLGSDFAQIIEGYWKDKLLISSELDFMRLPKQDQESRKIIFSLVTSNRDCGQRSSIEPCNVALANEGHLTLLPKLISEETREFLCFVISIRVSPNPIARETKPDDYDCQTLRRKKFLSRTPISRAASSGSNHPNQPVLPLSSCMSPGGFLHLSFASLSAP
jgi:hypothetical protein